MIRLFRYLFTGDNLVTTICIALIVGAIAHVLAGCHHAKPPDPPRVVVERRACLERPPPEPMPGAVVYDRGGNGECAEGYVMCIPRDGAIALVSYLEVIHDWARDAWSACGPLPPAPETPTLPGG